EWGNWTDPVKLTSVIEMLGPACSLSRKSDNAQGASALPWVASGVNCASMDLTLTDKPAQSKMAICPNGQFTSALYFESILTFFQFPYCRPIAHELAASLIEF